MVKLTQVGAVFAAIESAPGVAATLEYTGSAEDDINTTTTFIQAIDPVFTPDFNLVDRNFARPSLSGVPHLMGRRLGKISFSTDIFGTGVAPATTSEATQSASTPIWANLFEGCAMSGTNISTPAGRTYAPKTSSQKTLTIEVYFDGTLHKLTGAMGTWTINAKAGDIARIQWEFTGVYNDTTDVATPSTMSFASVTPPLVQSCTLQIGSTAASVFTWDEVTITQGNNVVVRPDGNSAQGIKSMYITGRDIKLSLNPEAVLEADHPFWADYVAATTKAITFTVGSTAGNKVSFSIPNAQGSNLSYEDRDGIRVLSCEMRAVTLSGTGNDELAIKFL